MDLALGSAAGSDDVDLQAAAFEFAIEPTLKAEASTLKAASPLLALA